MGNLGRVHQLIISLGDYKMTFNLEAIFMTWLAMACLIAFGIFATRKKGVIPHSIQVLGELFVSQLYGLTEDALDKEMAKTYGPLTCALFMFPLRQLDQTTAWITLCALNISLIF